MEDHGSNGCNDGTCFCEVAWHPARGNPGPEAEQAIESQPAPLEEPEQDPELDRRACEAVGIEPKWRYEFRAYGLDWRQGLIWKSWEQAEAARVLVLGDGIDTRPVRKLYSAVSSCPIASAKLCQAAIVAGLGWPVALAHRFHRGGFRYVGYVQEVDSWIENAAARDWTCPGEGEETKTPWRAIALAVAAAPGKDLSEACGMDLWEVEAWTSD